MVNVPFRIGALVILLAAVTSLGAQVPVSAVIGPSPAAPGQSVGIQITNASPQTITLPSTCVFRAVHAGQPNGAFVDAPLCGLALIDIPPGQSLVDAWTPPAGLPNGLYFFKVDYMAGGTNRTQWFPFSFQNPGDPTLQAQGGVQVGQTTTFTVDAPAYANGAYVVAVSNTTDTGLSLGPGLHVVLDQDPLFDLSFPTPLPGVFGGFQGGLDAAGHAGGITFTLPPAPQIANLGITFQVLVAPAPGAGLPLALTNPFVTTILP